MKQRLHSGALLLFFLLLISTSMLASTIAVPKQGAEEKLNELASGDSFEEVDFSESMNKLMGMEKCEKEDEECLERRKTAEVHLDYIYTQHHRH